MFIYIQLIHPGSNYVTEIMVANFLISMSKQISFTVIRGRVWALLCLACAQCNHENSLEKKKHVWVWLCSCSALTQQRRLESDSRRYISGLITATVAKQLQQLEPCGSRGGLVVRGLFRDVMDLHVTPVTCWPSDFYVSTQRLHRMIDTGSHKSPIWKIYTPQSYLNFILSQHSPHKAALFL